MKTAAAFPLHTPAPRMHVRHTRLWRILHHYVDSSRAERDDSQVREVGIDETASRRGHNYVSLFVDLEEAKVLYVAEGRSAPTVNEFRRDLEEHGGKSEQIEEVCCDLSPAFIKGIETAFPEAAITFDKFHVMRVICDAVDKTRRAERVEYPERKGYRYALLRNPESMSDREPDFTSQLGVRSRLHR